MVELKRRRFGLDICGARTILASRSMESGLNVIDMIEEVPEENLEDRLKSGEGDLYFSISENNALIKRIAQPYDHGLDDAAVARFEFASSLLDDPEKYFIDIHEIESTKARLAVGYNKSKVDEIIARLGARQDRPAGFKLRSLALAKAYLSLCKAEGGHLVCLIDIEKDHCTYCFVFDKTAVLPGALWFSSNNGQKQNSDIDRNMLDLAATVQYRLAELSRGGLSDPLSRLIISGPGVDDSVLSKLEKLLKISTGRPQPSKASFKDDLHLKAPEAMVALGLTIG